MPSQPEHILEKAKKIRIVIFDVDGVLTSGQLLYGSDGTEYKQFHIHDGLGMKWLHAAGIATGIITAKTSECVARRVQELGIQHYYFGQENKVPAYEAIKQQLQLSDEQIAYIGDDLPDLPLLRRAGLAMTVPAAPSIIREYADGITTRAGGQGAARELCELILTAQNQLTAVIQPYLQR